MKKNIKNVLKWFRSSVLAEYIYIFLVIVIVFLSVYSFTEKFDTGINKEDETSYKTALSVYSNGSNIDTEEETAIKFSETFDNFPTANIIEPTKDYENTVPTELSDNICDNYEEIEYFEKPIPIVWEARLDGCLLSCQGASFTRIPTSEMFLYAKEYKYPRFSGYYPDKYGGYTGEDISPIEKEFRQDYIALRVYGNWVAIDADHPYTVFSDKCVPLIDISKLEIIEF